MNNRTADEVKSDNLPSGFATSWVQLVVALRIDEQAPNNVEYRYRETQRQLTAEWGLNEFGSNTN